MTAYLELVMNFLPGFERFELVQIPHLEDIHANAIPKLASSKDSELLRIVLIEHPSKPSILKGEEVMWIDGTLSWMQPIISFLKDHTMPNSKIKA